MATTVCINPPTPQQTQTATDRVLKELSTKPIPYAFARGLAGGIVGNVIDNQLDPYDEGGVPYFTALGLLAGTRTGIRATGVVSSGIKTAVDATMPRQLKEWMQLDDIKRNQDYLDGYGATISATDVENVKGFKGAMRGVTKALASGRNGVEGLMKSSWVQSQFSQMREIAKVAPSANKMIRFMQDIPNQIKQMKADFQATYNARNGANAYENFISTAGLEIARPAMRRIQELSKGAVGEMDDRRILAELNESLYRIMDSGMGTEAYNPNFLAPGVQDVYGAKPWTRAFDQQLMADPRVREFIETTRDMYSRVNQEYEVIANRLVREKIDEITSILNDRPQDAGYYGAMYKQTMGFVEDFHHSGMSWKQYVQSIEGSEDFNMISATLHGMANETAESNRVVQLFHQIRKLQTQVNRMKEMDRTYIPHIEDRNKMQEIQNRLIARGKVRKVDDRRPEVADLPDFDTYVQRRVYDINYGGDRKLYSEDNELVDFAVKNYRTAKAAKEDLKNILTVKRGEGVITVEQYQQATRQLDNFIKKGVRNAQDGAKDVYYIEAPPELANVVESLNRGGFGNFYNKFRANQFDVKKSSRMDYQRKLDMPYEFRQTDLYQVNNSYANDVAPRLHSMRQGVYDVLDFRNKWTNQIYKELGSSPQSAEAKVIGDTIEGIYNTTMRINTFKNVKDQMSYEKMARFANAWRNIMAMAYQYGISYYNAFEHAVQTPLLTSWRSYGNTMGVFATSPRAANAWSDFIVDQKIITNKLSSQGGSHLMYDEVAGLTGAERLLERGAEFSSNFSVTKFIGHSKYNPIKFDVADTGLFRIVFDGFIGGNIMSTGVNARASLTELRKLTKIYKMFDEIPAGEVQSVVFEGRRYNIGEVERKLSLLGINETNIQGYMHPRTQAFLEETMGTLDAGQRLTEAQILDNAEALGYIRTVLNNSTENYQATNQFYRPQKASEPIGRVAYQYSTYSYNQLLQNYQMRMRFPIENWTNTLSPEAASNFNALKVGYYYNKGDFEALRKMGFTNENIQNFPADAYGHYLRFLVAAMGVSTVGHMGVDALRDTLAYPFKEDEADQWRRLNRRKIVNIFQPASEQYTFGEMFDGSVSPDMLHLIQYGATLLMDSGMAGRYDMIYSSWDRQSITDFTPITRGINDFVMDINKITRGGFGDIAETMTDVTVRNALRFAPVYGGSVFSEQRMALQRYLLNKEEGRQPRLDGGPIVPQLIVPR